MSMETDTQKLLHTEEMNTKMTLIDLDDEKF